MRKLLTILATLALLSISLIAPVTTEATTHSCVSNPSVNQFNGNIMWSQKSPVPWSYHDVKATFDPTVAGFKPCTSSFGADGPSVWVSVEPNYYSGNRTSSTILQIGVTACNNNNAACTYDDDGKLHYFWADGGCNGDTPVATNLGEADTAAHTYEIVYNDFSDTWDLFVDPDGNGGGLKVVEVPYNSSHISCWSQEGTLVTAFGERWDGGDSYADSGDHLNVTNFQFRSESDGYSTWRDPCKNCSLSTSEPWAATGTQCDVSDDGWAQYSGTVYVDDKCDIVGTKSFDLWSQLP